MPTVEFLRPGGVKGQYEEKREVPDRDVSKILQSLPRDEYGSPKNCYGFKFYDEVGDGNGGVKIENVSGNFYIGTRMSMREIEEYAAKLESGKTFLRNLQDIVTRSPIPIKEFVKTKNSGFRPLREGIDVVALVQ